MPANRTPDYNENDLRELLNEVGDWASGWDDVLLYLHEPRRGSVIRFDRIAALRRDIESLQDRQARFTRDYRKIWQRLTGMPGERLPPPDRADPHAMDPFEIEVDYFGDLEFPADKRLLIRAARLNGAPGRVMERIEALENTDYRNRDELLEDLHDADWSATQQSERTRIPRSRRS